MTTKTQTLTDFLLARIAEDEEAGTAGDHWDLSGSPMPDVPVQFWDYGETHIGYRRFLAECEAKRLIVAEHSGDDAEEAALCETCNDLSNPYLFDFGRLKPYPCPTLRALALPYAEHPDLREEWRA
jgi:hypothetical protein